MIVIRQINFKDYEKVKLILEKEEIMDDLTKGIVYVLIENDIIIGLGKINVEDEYGILKYILINKKNRGLNLGDSILRTLLFRMESMGIKEVYYHENNDYFLNKGFKYSKTNFKKSYPLYINIKEFFERKCCGDGNEI